MRLKSSLAALLLLSLSPPLLSAEESYTLTAQEYDQIVTSLMTAQKALRESDGKLRTQEAELKKLSQALRQASKSLEEQRIKAAKDKIMIGGCAFCLGLAGSAAVLYLSSQK